MDPRVIQWDAPLPVGESVGSESKNGERQSAGDE
jgi:hypothetical protein